MREFQGDFGVHQTGAKPESVLRGKLVLARIASELQTVNAGLQVKPIGAPRPLGGSAGAPRGSGI